MECCDSLARVVRPCPRPYCGGTLIEDVGRVYTCGLCARQFTPGGEPVTRELGTRICVPRLAGRHDG